MNHSIIGSQSGQSRLTFLSLISLMHGLQQIFLKVKFKKKPRNYLYKDTWIYQNLDVCMYVCM